LLSSRQDLRDIKYEVAEWQEDLGRYPRYEISHRVVKLDYRPSPSDMALSRVPGDEELYVGG
jgi:hypothetical protein